MRDGIVLSSGQLVQFYIDQAKMEFGLAAPHTPLGSLLFHALSQPLNKLDLVENRVKVRTIFTVLNHPGFFVIRSLKVDSSSSAIAESDVVNAWRTMVNATIGYLSDFENMWNKVGSISKELLEPRPISKMVKIVVRL
jgi:hypothetical protein